jgi:NhaA family Na+:H+ antiporter
LRKFLDNSGLLIVGTAVALVWANLDEPSYRHAADALHFFVNDIAMTIFFALAAKEVVEAAAPGGALHSPRHSTLPLLAAIGGMVGPALIYLTLTRALGLTELRRGWAIPTATDIAFSYMAARFVFGRVHPAIPFLLLLAIADDAFGLLIIAVFYPSGELHPVEFVVIMSAALAIAWALRRRGTVNFWPYLTVAGVVSWIAFHRGGLHPALALVPIIPFLPHASRDAGLFVDDERALDTLNELERWWKTPAQIILFFFGLTNAGVAVTNLGPGTWIVLAAIVCGKPAGILASAYAGTAIGLRKPNDVTWNDLAVLGCLAGIGFTVSLFFATASFPSGALLDQTKLGALLSFFAAGVAALSAKALGVGRFRPAGTRLS